MFGSQTYVLLFSRDMHTIRPMATKTPKSCGEREGRRDGKEGRRGREGGREGVKGK